MKIIIGKHFEFEASHQLPEAECYGKCSNLHGHRYELQVEVSGDINSYGWICNFSDVKEVVKRLVINKLDHQHLNQFFDLPTAEHIAVWIYKQIEEEIKEKDYTLERVKLYETSNSYAEIRRS